MIKKYKNFLVTLKKEERSFIATFLKEFFLGELPPSISVREIVPTEIYKVYEIQEQYPGILRQNNREELQDSMEKGIWVGFFKGDVLEAYTVLEFELISDVLLVYLKVTCKRKDSSLRNLQKLTLEMRTSLAEELAARSMLLFAGGYITCSGANTRCLHNLDKSGLYRLFRVKDLYGPSPTGDRLVFGYGDIGLVEKVLKRKWEGKDFEPYRLYDYPNARDARWSSGASL